MCPTTPEVVEDDAVAWLVVRRGDGTGHAWLYYAGSLMGWVAGPKWAWVYPTRDMAEEVACQFRGATVLRWSIGWR